METNSLKRLGSAISRKRAKLGINQTELGKLLNSSKSAVSRIENGEVAIDADIMQNLDEILQADGMLIDLWALAQLGSMSSTAMAQMEKGASIICDWDLRVVPGLLQAPDYTRGFMRAGRATPEQIDREVAIRAERQRILGSAELAAAWFVIDAGVLLRPYGGRSAMREQLLHLEEMGQQQNIFIQVMPYTAINHPGGEGPTRVIQYQDKPAVWYTEGWSSGSVTAGRAEVSQAIVNFDLIRASALPPGPESAGYIATIRGSHYE
jgi:transcriptional regulator with XRE-family HTH domain